MKDWQHNIHKIHPSANYPKIYTICGETINNQNYDHTKWSHEVDSKGKLLSAHDNNYYNTMLYECLFDYLENQSGQETMIFKKLVTDIIYHVREDGYLWKE